MKKLVSRGISERDAREQVAETFSVHPETVRRWARRSGVLATATGLDQALGEQIVDAMQRLIDEGVSRNRASRIVADKYGVHQNTAKNWYEKLQAVRPDVIFVSEEMPAISFQLSRRQVEDEWRKMIQVVGELLKNSGAMIEASDPLFDVDPNSQLESSMTLLAATSELIDRFQENFIDMALVAGIEATQIAKWTNKSVVGIRARREKMNSDVIPTTS
ncbi:hypothetical protein [Jongsikchunia kroppenstedtii]|uniref:hypothetical protein n=1 Tax=Jongsikchunia kroppenstedtii TaxID=1121721 RepID=UPI0012DC111C|nr:hypothetical protein [Jongsikchunia kroppenstedtii]